MNIEQLVGAELDFWVAKARGLAAELRGMYGHNYCRVDMPRTGHQVYEPTQNGLLSSQIARERLYTVFPRRDACAGGAPPVWVWIAEAQQNPVYHGLFCDPSPHVAICRLCVAEAIAEKRLINIGALPPSLPASPRDLESRALAAMTDEQALQSFDRWKASATTKGAAA